MVKSIFTLGRNVFAPLNRATARNILSRRRAIALLVVCAVLFCGATAYAEQDSFSFNGSEVTLSVAVPESAYGFGTLFIADSDAPAGIDSVAVNANVVYVNTADITDSRVSYVIPLRSNLSDKTYNVYFIAPDADEAVFAGTFDFVSDATLAALTDDMDGSTLDNITSKFLTADNLASLQKLYADVAGYNAITNKTDFHKMLINQKPYSGDIEKLLKVFNSSVLLNGINSADVSKIDGILLGKSDLLELDNGEYISLKQNQSMYSYYSILAKSTLWNLAELKTAYNTANFLTRIVASQNKTQVKAAFDAYGTIFSIDFSAMPASDYSRGLVYQELIGYNTLEISDLLGKFAQATAKVNGTGTSGTGTGGGGGSTGGGYSSGKAVPQGGVVLSALPEVAASAVVIGDVEGHHAQSQITDFVRLGIIDGGEAFEPDVAVKRDYFVKLLVSALGWSLTSNPHFDDVTAGDEAFAYISTAIEHGIIAGVSESMFDGGADITRQDVAVIINRCFNVEFIKPSVSSDGAVTDMDYVSDYAKKAVERLVDAKIILGDENGRFNPMNSCSRAEAVVIIHRTVKLIGQSKEGTR